MNYHQNRKNTLLINGKDYPYLIKKSKRAKYFRINIHQNGNIELIVPRYGTIKQAQSFLYEKTNWIKQNLEKLRPKLEQAQNFKGELWKKLMFKGKIKTVDIIYTDSKKPSFFPGNHSLIFHIPKKFKDQSSVRIKELLKSEAKSVIKFRTKILSEIMNLKYNVIRIKDQKTLWGSCSCKRNLNFNWKLIMLPPEVMDYIIIHELAHLAHPDHSTRFWDLVSRFSPRQKKHRKWLRENLHILKI